MSLSLVALSGSLRRDSFNSAIVRSLPELAPAGVTVTALDGLGDIPLYNADLQAEGFPPAVEAMAKAMAAADGVILVTPEYNYSVPGALKNAIDWISRLPQQPLAGKPVAIQSASMGVLGGSRAQYHLRQILVFLDALVLNKPEVMVGAVHTKVTDGKLSDAGTRDFIASQLTSFEAFIKRVSA